MKTSWKRCIEFSNMAQAYLARTKGETKLKYAVNRTLVRIQKQQDTVNERLADIEIDHCLTEKQGDNDVIVRDAQGNLQYTKVKIKERNKARSDYLSRDEIEVEPYFSASLPSDLNEFEIEAFAGFVISTEDAERLLQECKARAETESTKAVVQPNGNQAAVSAIA